MKILIAGMPKTGTTLLYCKIKNSMPRDTDCLFEPLDFVSKLKKDNVLAKILISPYLASNFGEDLSKFDKKILIIRDLRDWIVSDLLYSVYHKPYCTNRIFVEDFIKLLEKKEKDPNSLPLVDIINMRDKFVSFFYNPTDPKKYLVYQNDFERNNKDFFVIKYEDIIDGRLEELEKYLGLKLESKTSVDEKLKRVERKKTYGDWKNWFTKEDVLYFKPIFDDFLKSHKYLDAWDIEERKEIMPEYSSLYVKRIIEEATLEKLKSVPEYMEIKRKVSVIMPSYNYSWCIDEAIESVINQDHKNWELIIIEDGSADDSLEIIERYTERYPEKIKLFFHPNHQNMGLSKTCQLGLEKASGDYIAFLEADDVWKSDFISSKIEVFERYPEVNLVYNDVEFFGSESIFRQQKIGWENFLKNIPVEKPYCATNFALKQNPINTFSSFMSRKDAFLGLNFNSKIKPWLDWWIIFQISKKGLFYFQNSKKTKWRRHSESYDYSFYNKLKNTDKEIKEMRDQLSKLENNEIDLEKEVEEKKVPVKLISFYFPQFHNIEENDRWWGSGFTEWTNVKKGQPHFIGHLQPKVPSTLGYYNLSDQSTAEAQAEMAKKYGIFGFCYYYYWFSGKKLLDMPLNRMLKTGRPDFPFCICWANENWTRRWDGLDNEILIKQSHLPEDNINLIKELAPIFLDRRYIRIKGKPLFIVYRADRFLDLKKTISTWRDYCRKNGVGEIHLSMVQSFGIKNPVDYGFDSALEFPPHNITGQPNQKDNLQIINKDFFGTIYDYKTMSSFFTNKKYPAYKLFKGVCPAWDNSARRKNNPLIFINSSPENYQKWLESTINISRSNNDPEEKLVFINAWNEWGEGCYLEPDKDNGDEFLVATKKALENTNYGI